MFDLLKLGAWSEASNSMFRIAEIVKAASDTEHRIWLERIAKSIGKRGAMACAALAALEPTP